MPAAAVIPAPVAYLKVVAVKKLVVGLLQIFLQSSTGLRSLRVTFCKSVFCCDPVYPSLGWIVWINSFTLRKIVCSKQAFRLEYVSMG